MDSLANYGSDGENSDQSEDPKIPQRRSRVMERKASDVNYDPVQMDMSEDSNNNNSSGDSNSERAPSPPVQSCSASTKSNSARRVSPDQRRPESEGSRESRGDKNEKYRQDEKPSRRLHDDLKRRDSEHRDKRLRENDRKSRNDDRRREKSSSSKDERREDRKDERSEKDRSDHREDRRERRRDRDRRHSRNDRTKDRHRDERPHHKDKDRTRSRSRSKDRTAVPFRAMSYREEKGRNKLAQLEKLGIELKAPEGILATPGMEPNFYNPLATATQGKYAEQIQKRKLLWANKTKQDEGKAPAPAAITSTWAGTTFTQDQDGKMTAKFKRLMGIKGDIPATPAPGQKPDILKKQEEMFNNMEQQYEVARATTHTQRGVGLGYASGYQFPR